MTSKTMCPHSWQALYLLGWGEPLGYLCALCGGRLSVEGYQAFCAEQAVAWGFSRWEGLRLYRLNEDAGGLYAN